MKSNKIYYLDLIQGLLIAFFVFLFLISLFIYIFPKKIVLSLTATSECGFTGMIYDATTAEKKDEVVEYELTEKKINYKFYIPVQVKFIELQVCPNSTIELHDQKLIYNGTSHDIKEEIINKWTCNNCEFRKESNKLIITSKQNIGRVVVTPVLDQYSSSLCVESFLRRYIPYLALVILLFWIFLQITRKNIIFFEIGIYSFLIIITIQSRINDLISPKQPTPISKTGIVGGAQYFNIPLRTQHYVFFVQISTPIIVLLILMFWEKCFGRRYEILKHLLLAMTIIILYVRLIS